MGRNGGGRREQIIDTAIELFNEAGTGAVSTNHIAEALGISPGNLYYHFRNKEEIIRAIFARMGAAWSEVNTLPADRPPTIADLHRLFGGNFATLWEYRFYYRELLALMGRDPQLRQGYEAVRRQGFANIEVLIQRLIEADVLAVPGEAKIRSQLAQMCWLVADFWLPFVELGGEPVGPAQLREGVDLIMRILHPYLTATARVELTQLGLNAQLQGGFR